MSNKKEIQKLDLNPTTIGLKKKQIRNRLSQKLWWGWGTDSVVKLKSTV
ncbi:hypothetical protein FK220_005250 [Flavobacteriaceae bacterium TP-CH-4]|uniref:Uncharacterized protein n=1 Tax=Pelagihabitans pacificus TaxID=2696054 RepID=A0A967AT45_9FLAO|nr:hypothetical protein [Pelagihabitans pacificus]NHF58735.1 hypothetical protein [Pelagihabitans pacificus]